MTTETQTQPLVSNGVIGMFLLISTEVMMFSGFISAFLVARANFSTWPPLGQPRLPVEATAINTIVLILSGVALWYANRQVTRAARQRYLMGAVGLGALFVLVQGAEWVRLIQFGLTSTSSLYGSYFYLIVGAHALHAIVGLGFLAWFLRQGAPKALSVLSLYWYFVVALWPVLYGLVYLS